MSERANPKLNGDSASPVPQAREDSGPRVVPEKRKTPELEFVGFRVEPRSKAKLEVMAEQYGVSLQEIGRVLLNVALGDSDEIFGEYSQRKAIRERQEKTGESVSDILIQLDRVEKMRDGLAREITNALNVRKVDKAGEERLRGLGIQFAATEKKFADLKGKFLGVPVSPDLRKEFTGENRGYRYTVR